MVVTEEQTKNKQKNKNTKKRENEKTLARNSSNPRPNDYNTKALTTVPSICCNLVIVWAL